MVWLLASVFFAAGLGVWLWSEWQDHRDESFWPGCLRSVVVNIISALLVGMGLAILLFGLLYVRS